MASSLGRGVIAAPRWHDGDMWPRHRAAARLPSNMRHFGMNQNISSKPARIHGVIIPSYQSREYPRIEMSPSFDIETSHEMSARDQSSIELAGAACEAKPKRERQNNKDI